MEAEQLRAKALAEVILRGATRIHLDGQTWVRHDADSPEDLLAQARLKIGELTERVDVLEAALREMTSNPIHDALCQVFEDWENPNAAYERAVEVLKQQPEGETE